MSTTCLFVLQENEYSCYLCDVIYAFKEYDDEAYVITDNNAIACINCMSKHWSNS
jgi:hypothetical protein